MCLVFEWWMTPEIIYMYLEGYMSLTRSNVLHLDIERYTPEIVEKLHQKGYVLHSHLKTADRTLFEKAISLGLDQCTFDDVEILKFI